ncbi:HAD family hydrolase [Deinococcus aquatilis]|uniref:HAD family hydrolase n=1 Tax=Deinococcus aquatilis TaxID=519440 RepID=UPI0003691AE4|nr:HAD family hydrolase [Deinococcus aquatilis]
MYSRHSSRALSIDIRRCSTPEPLGLQTLERTGLIHLVDDVVISKAVSLSKPNPAIYHLSLEPLQVDAADAWFVGDSPRNDVWGPQQVGLRAAYLPTGHPIGLERPDAVLHDLRDVLNLV